MARSWVFLLAFWTTWNLACSQCQYSESGYTAKWEYNDGQRAVTFTITATAPPGLTSYWTGIGFGARMSGGDFIIATINNGQVDVSDRYGTGYSQPIRDTQQDVTLLRSQTVGSQVELQFSRPLITNDPNDNPLVDPSQNGCQNFMFPVSPGAASGQTISPHASKPIVKQICNINQCVSQQPQPVIASGPGQPQPIAPQPVVQTQPPPPTQGGQPNFFTSPVPVTQGPPVGGGGACAGQDRAVCPSYIDNYFVLVFGTPNPTSAHPNYFLKPQACNMLIGHQGGIVVRSCCNYMRQKCGEFIS